MVHYNNFYFLHANLRYVPCIWGLTTSSVTQSLSIPQLSRSLSQQVQKFDRRYNNGEHVPVLDHALDPISEINC